MQVSNFCIHGVSTRSPILSIVYGRSGGDDVTVTGIITISISRLCHNLAWLA